MGGGGGGGWEGSCSRARGLVSSPLPSSAARLLFCPPPQEEDPSSRRRARNEQTGLQALSRYSFLALISREYSSAGSTTAIAHLRHEGELVPVLAPRRRQGGLVLLGCLHRRGECGGVASALPPSASSASLLLQSRAHLVPHLRPHLRPHLGSTSACTTDSTSPTLSRQCDGVSDGGAGAAGASPSPTPRRRNHRSPRAGGSPFLVSRPRPARSNHPQQTPPPAGSAMPEREIDRPLRDGRRRGGLQLRRRRLHRLRRGGVRVSSASSAARRREERPDAGLRGRARGRVRPRPTEV